LLRNPPLTASKSKRDKEGPPSKVNLKPTDKVLEVEPSTGNLMVRILETAKHVTAVEMDPWMAAESTKLVQEKRAVPG